MSACEPLVAEASAGAGAALRAVDCIAGESVAAAFGRLFGANGGLAPALTVLLTLYIAFFAFSLLTGRSRIGISALTPRMLTLGLVLTFATSWVAYSQVLWNLTIGAPDQIAGILMGAKGSATQMFADRMDMVFAAIADASSSGQAAQAQAQQAAQGTAQAAASGSFTPANLMWLAALMLLLGTVGVLVTARIALAVLLAVGPVFVVFALFGGTRGLTAGWLRGLVLTAVTPLFVVVGGSMVMELLVPVVAALNGVEGVDGRAALALFLIAAVHVALMGMVLKVAGTIVSGWRVFGMAAEPGEGRGAGGAASAAAAAVAPLMPSAIAPQASNSAAAVRRAVLPAVAAPEAASAAPGGSGGSRGGRTIVTRVEGAAASPLPVLPRSRARGIGSRFAAPRPKASARAGGMIR